MIQKLKEIKEMCPEILAQIQLGKLSLCDVGEIQIFFEDMAESLRNGIKSRMCDQNIALEENERVSMKIAQKYKYDYIADPAWIAQKLNENFQKQKTKEYEQNNTDNPNVQVELVKVLTIKAK